MKLGTNARRLVGAIAVLAAMATSALAADAASFEHRALAEKLTQTIVSFGERYRLATSTERGRILAELTELTQTRRELLSLLVQDDPGAVLRVAVPAAIRERMPARIRDRIEAEGEVEGELETAYEDDDTSSRLVYALRSGGRRLELRFAADFPELPTGARVRVRGVEIDGTLALSSGDTSVQVVSVPPAETFGEQRTAVLLVNFQTNPGAMPWTLDDARSRVFGATSDFFRENSSQQTWLAGEAFGWYTLPIDPTCSGSAISSAADQAVTDAGIDLSSYTRYVYVFPYVSGCGWSGKGTVGGTPSRTWINGSFTSKVAGHELGHNFGLFHSHALECGATTLGDNCLSDEYGDTLDIMGNPSSGHLSAFQKERLGWLNYAASPPIATINADGTYELEPYETAGGGPKALKIAKSTDATTGATTWYYVEFRQAIGFDAFLSSNTNVLTGVVVHTGAESSGDTGYLLDMTPSSASSGDRNDPALVVGQTFSDPASGVTIDTLWANGTGAGVRVSLAASQCAHANPTLALSPSESQWVAPGTPVTYTVTVTNHDGTECGASIFDLSTTVPSGWIATFAAAALSIEPGSSGSTTLTVTSSSSAADGFYTVDAVASNDEAPAYSGSSSATYVVSAPPANQAPVAVDDVATTKQGTSVRIAVLANDRDPENAPLTIVSVTNGASGRVQVNADGTVTYSPNRKFTGEDRFTYSISDGQLTATATVTVNVAGGKTPRR